MFQDKKARLMLPCNDKVSAMIQKLKHGWNYGIEIIVAYDTSKNISLIVDGKNHALALYYLSLHKQTLLQELLKINNNVNLCQTSLVNAEIYFHIILLNCLFLHPNLRLLLYQKPLECCF